MREITDVFKEITDEKERQEKRWGYQYHSLICHPYTLETIQDMAKAGEEKIVNAMFDDEKNLSWFAILQGAVFEAFTEIGLIKQREKMIEVAAIVVEIIQHLDKEIELRKMTGGAE